jgi:hypothetical protein
MKKIIFSFLTFILISSILSTTYDLSSDFNRNGEISKLFSKNLRFLKNNDLSADNCDKRVNPFEPNSFYFFPVFKAKLYKKTTKSNLNHYVLKQTLQH